MLRWFNGNLQTNDSGEWVDVPVVIDQATKQAEMCAACGSWIADLSSHVCWVKQING